MTRTGRGLPVSVALLAGALAAQVPLEPCDDDPWTIGLADILAPKNDCPVDLDPCADGSLGRLRDFVLGGVEFYELEVLEGGLDPHRAEGSRRERHRAAVCRALRGQRLAIGDTIWLHAGDDPLLRTGARVLQGFQPPRDGAGTEWFASRNRWAVENGRVLRSAQDFCLGDAPTLDILESDLNRFTFEDCWKNTATTPDTTREGDR